MEEGVTPLEYMLKIMRDESDHEDPKIQIAREAMRFEAAKAAAPYMHPRLAAIEHTGADGAPLFEKPAETMTDDEIRRELAGIQAQSTTH